MPSPPGSHPFQREYLAWKIVCEKAQVSSEAAVVRSGLPGCRQGCLSQIGAILDQRELAQRGLVTGTCDDSVPVVTGTIAIQLTVDRHQHVSGITSGLGQNGPGKITINLAFGLIPDQASALFQIEQCIFHGRCVIPARGSFSS